MANTEGFRNRPNIQSENKDASCWWDQAACKNDFDFIKNKTNKIAEKKAICGNCPVEKACLDDAMSYGDLTLFRAGRTPSELRAEYSTRGLKREEKNK